MELNRKDLTVVICVCLLAAALSSQLRAQVTTGTLMGIVVDQSGASLPAAEVSLANQGTGAVSQKTTSQAGEFVFNFVPVGNYTLTISMPAFKTLKLEGLEIQAAQNIRRTFMLDVGQTVETVSVSAEAPLVNTVSPEQRESFSSLMVSQLPLARRNFSNVLEQNSGTVEAGPGLLNLNGLGASGTRVTVDGTEGNANGKATGTSMYLGFNKIDLLSLESIQEVQVVKGVIPAEYGHILSGNINVITKSGTNEWHGSLFYNYQGAALAARHQFATSKPNLVWNQFGGSSGGPIVKNRLFVFGAYEGYRESTFNLLTSNVPTESFREKMSASLQFPETKMLLDLLPLPNQPHSSEASAAIWQGPATARSDDNHIDLKTDYLVGNQSAVAVTYTRGRPGGITPRLPKMARTFEGLTDRLTTVFTSGGASWTSESRFGLNYNIVNRADSPVDITDPNTEETLEGQRRLPVMRCDLCPFNIATGEIHSFDPKPFYSIEQKLALVRGQHSLKFGGNWALRGGGRFNVETASVQFRNATDLLANQPSAVTTTFGTPEFVGRDFHFGFFIQDDWRLSRRFVLNLGLRYDYYSNYTAKVEGQETQFNSAGLFNPDGLLDANFNLGPMRDPEKAINPDSLNFGPRLGFVYNPDGNGNTTIRGGFSMTSMPMPVGTYILSVARTPTLPFRTVWSRAEAANLGLQWPVYNEDVFPIVDSLNQVRIGNVFDPDLDNPYAYNLYLGVQRAITKTAVLETAFVGTRGLKLLLHRSANQPDRLTGERPNPGLGGFTYLDGSQQSAYYSWQSSLRKRLSSDVSFNVHYTWAKALAHAGGDTATTTESEITLPVQDFFCIECEWGPATMDIRHVFNANVLYASPRLDGLGSSFVRNVFGGWQVSAMLNSQTGRPFNVSQPNVLPSQRPDIVDPDGAINENCCGFGALQYLNPGAFMLVPENPVSGATIRPGNIGNHALRGPGQWTIDLGLGKDFPLAALAEGARFQVRVDFLNALNHTNYTSVSAGIRSGNFGRVTNSTGARVVQVNARIDF